LVFYFKIKIPKITIIIGFVKNITFKSNNGNYLLPILKTIIPNIPKSNLSITNLSKSLGI